MEDCEDEVLNNILRNVNLEISIRQPLETSERTEYARLEFRGRGLGSIYNLESSIRVMMAGITDKPQTVSGFAKQKFIFHT